jgi:membrane protease subunit (stomatin/prohibitin family)
MNVKDIRELYSAAPFHPFEMVMTNGATVRVAHPEFMALSPTGRTVVVFEQDGHLAIDVPLIIATKTFENGSKPRKRKQ